MYKSLLPLEIEELEHIHFERIRYYILDNINDIKNGLYSRLEIKDDWYDKFILTKNNVLHFPRLQEILKGTTLERCLQLAKESLKISHLETDITEADLMNAKEVFMIGTTLDILPVHSYENTTFTVNQVGAKLLSLIRTDQK